MLPTSCCFTSRNMARRVFGVSVQFLLLLLFFHGANSLVKPGTCPETDGGICVLECESDDFCPGEEKCCYNGCGHTCQRPEKPECPELNCDLDCTEFGYKLDDHGCALCECFVEQCPMFRCLPCPKFYNYTVIQGQICRGCDCVDSVQCPPLGCKCPDGYKPDTRGDGCPFCRCVPEEPTCAELNCNLDCSDSGYKLDLNGCAMCECYRDPCPNVRCRACPEFYNYSNISGNMCQGCECVSNVDCPQLHCECPEGYKLDTDINECPTCRCVPEPRCQQLNCELDCTGSGYKLDDNGCALCECFVNQCPMIDCVSCPKFYNYELMEGRMCQGCDCVDSVQCPPLGCKCPDGYKPDTGGDGCPFCRCVPEEPMCPELNCNLDCSDSGYKLDDNGCALCECYMDPCPMFKCRACPEFYNYRNISGNMCRGCECVSSVDCPKLHCECPEGYKLDTDGNECPTCRCVPEPRCPQLTCDLDCRESGYKLDDNGCALCECYMDPCPMLKCGACPKYYNYRVIDGNIFRGCECVDSVQCPPLGCKCPDGYKPDTRGDGCPFCRCVPEEPTCPELNCNLDCSSSGYKLYDNGCPMCECYVDPCPMFGCVMPCPKYYNYTNIEGNVCRACDCVSSVQCPEVQCECLGGANLDTDINGCPTCRCVFADGFDQDDLGCPMRLCAHNCPSGYTKDENGCPTCTCSNSDNYYIFIIVGCLVALLIVCVIVGIVLYKRRSKNNQSVSSNNSVKEPLNEKYVVIPAGDVSIDDAKNPKGLINA